MLQNARKTLGFKINMVYKIPPGGEVNKTQPVAYCFLLLLFCFLVGVYCFFLNGGGLVIFLVGQYISK